MTTTEQRPPSGDGAGDDDDRHPGGTTGDVTEHGHHDPELAEAFERAVEAGGRRLDRTWPALLSTGVVGGLDVGVGVLALLVVRDETGSVLLGALAFGIGFVALTLAHSELFTENFLVPVVAALTRTEAPLPALLARLWGATLIANWLGGWVVMALVMSALPHLDPVAVEVGRVYPELGIGWVAFSSAMLGGMVITLMTWMERANESVPAKLAAAVGAAFVLAAPPLNHSVIAALEMFAGLFADASYGYADAFAAAGWAVLGNLVGGVGLVTVLRLVQVGREKVNEVHDRPDGQRRPAPTDR